MGPLDATEFWRKDFVAILRLIGSAAARLPYGVPEPVLGGHAAVELYTGGLWAARQVELLTAKARHLRSELVEAGFRWEECSPGDGHDLRHPWFDRDVIITERAPIDANVVTVEIGMTGRQDTTTVRLIGIEDLIADQITGWLRHGGRRGAITTLIQVLVELGRAGVAGRFRPAYLQRRLARETEGEALLELPFGPSGLDDPLPRTTSLPAIASVVANWCASRGLPLDGAADLMGDADWPDRRLSRTWVRREMIERSGEGTKTAQIIPFRPYSR